MKEKASWLPRLWFPGRDGEKNPIREELANAATNDCARLLEYADRKSIDPAQAQDMAETLVEEIASKQQDVSPSKRIRDPRRYIYTAFVRAINALRKKEERYERVPIAEVDRLGAIETAAERIDHGVLVNEIISMMEPETRRTFWWLHEGYQWKEIAQQQGMTVNAAKIAYARGREKVRARIERGLGNRKR